MPAALPSVNCTLAGLGSRWLIDHSLGDRKEVPIWTLPHCKHLLLNPPIGTTKEFSFEIRSSSKVKLPLTFVNPSEDRIGELIMSYRGSYGLERAEVFISKILSQDPFVKVRMQIPTRQ